MGLKEKLKEKHTEINNSNNNEIDPIQESDQAGTHGNEKIKVVENINKIAANTEELEVKKEDHSEKSIEAIIIDIGSNIFGIETKYCTEIINLQYITPVPRTEECLLGLINLRNEIVSIIDLNIFFLDNFTPVKEGSKIILLDHNNIQTGILINKTRSLVTVQENDIICDLAHLNLKYQDYIKYLARVKGKNVQIIDIEKLFSSEKFNNLENLGS